MGEIGREGDRLLLHELGVRATVALLVLVFERLLTVAGTAGAPGLRAVALLGLALNVPYYLAARTWRWPRGQATVRVLLDVGLVTLGLALSGGLAAAPYLGLYVFAPLYAGLLGSPRVCLLTTATATVSYLAVTVLQGAGWLSLPTAVPIGGWPVAAFNLLIVGLVGGLTAVVADARRRREGARQALTEALEQAYDEALRVNAEIRRGAQLTALGEVVAGVTHELSNVLTVAFGHVGLARRKVNAQAPEISEHLAQVEQSFEAALRIIKNALHTARAAGCRAAVNIREEAARIVRLKGYDLQRDGISVRLEFPEPFPAAVAAPSQMLHVLLTLVNDAQRALRETSGPRTLEIVGTTRSAHVVVEVHRTGSAIAPEDLSRMFEPFSTPTDDSAGLGLAVAAGILRALGGELVAENRPQGGALFRLTLPTHDQSQAAGAETGGASR